MPSAAHPLCLLALALVALGPCGPIPGGELSGPVVERPVEDWSFANAAPRCAVEVRADALHSVTVNCFSWQRQLFVSCSRCQGKTWSSHALENAAGRIRIGEQLYPVTLRRVEAPDTLDALWGARAAKLGEPASPRPQGWWAFQLESR